MARKAKTALKTSRRKATPRSIQGPATVRMYCQGLGDCFLVSFPRKSGEQPFRILIDCGVLQKTPDDEAKLNAVANDLWKETGGRIDLLVVTHEHWDHVA